MKACIKKLSFVSALMAGFSLMLAGSLTAQTFTTLHNFTTLGSIPFSNSDGAMPLGGLTLSGSALYGTTRLGGSWNTGTVFKINTDGTGFTNLHSMAALSPNNDTTLIYTNSDGADPWTGLIVSANTLYGTTQYGGATANGTVFAVNTDGTGFTNLHSFTAWDPNTHITNSDGAHPYDELVLSGSTLYGTTSDGGSSDGGTVFAINTDTGDFMTLYNFSIGSGPSDTNSDGHTTQAGLILSGNTIYGVGTYGGISGSGTIFAVNTDGMDFTNLYSFTATRTPFAGTNSDGADPTAGLIISGSTLYGTADRGGSWDFGTVFAVNTDGTGFTNLYSFTGGSDGANPYSSLVLSGSTLYGTTVGGGSSGNGTVFAVNTDGTGFTNLYSFTGGSDGANPYSSLVLSGSTLYGTASAGGSTGNGTVFSLSFSPQLAIVPAGANVILTWPTNVAGFDYSGFTLQCTPDLVSPAWSAVSPGPTAVNGQNTVTNPVAGAQMFFRLSR